MLCIVLMERQVAEPVAWLGRDLGSRALGDIPDCISNISEFVPLVSIIPKRPCSWSGSSRACGRARRMRQCCACAHSPVWCCMGTSIMFRPV